MLIVEVNDKKYEFNTNIGTVKRIEAALGKPFMKIGQNFENLTFDEIETLLLCGLKDKDKKAELKEEINENMGLERITNIVKDFFEALQYTGLTEKEIKEKKAEFQKNLMN